MPRGLTVCLNLRFNILSGVSSQPVNIKPKASTCRGRSIAAGAIPSSVGEGYSLQSCSTVEIAVEEPAKMNVSKSLVLAGFAGSVLLSNT